VRELIWNKEDVDRDKDTDMILHFRTQETGITATDTTLGRPKTERSSQERIPLESSAVARKHHP
jgi:hypothetical protein